jgi:hypothetical protein
MGDLSSAQKDAHATMRTSFMEGELQVEYHLTETNTPQLKNFLSELN